MTKWIFLGDDSRRIFVSKILKKSLDEISEDKSIILRRGKDIFTEEIIDDNILCYKSYFVLPETEIFLPAYSADINISEENFDYCAIFEMFPFAKESTENFVKLLGDDKKNYPAILFVMMNVVEEDENSPVGLNPVKRIYLRKNRDVVIYRNESDILKILHWHKPLGSDIVNLVRRELKEISVRADNIEIEYESFLLQEKNDGLLSGRVENKITSFDSVKRQTLIWMSYKNSALKILFKGKNPEIKSLTEFYKQILFHDENSLAALIWNISAECKKLEDKLQKKFESIFQTPKKFQSFLNTEETYSEHIYRALIREGGRFGGIDKVFITEYEKFFKKSAKDIFISELRTHIKDLKNILEERHNKLS